MRRHHPGPLRLLSAACVAATLGLGVAACGSSSSSSPSVSGTSPGTTPVAPRTTSAASAGPASSPGGTGVFPAAKCDGTSCYTAAPPEPGSAIPTQTVKFGFRAPADNAFYFVAGKQGYFKDVGIDISPSPYGVKESSTNALSLVLSGTTSLGALCGCELVPTLANNTGLAMMVLTDEGVSLGIYAKPSLGLHGFAYYLARGMSVKQALHAALAPLDKPGSKIYTSLGDSTGVFTALAFKLAGLTEPQTPTVDDGTGMAIARDGGYDFYDPAPAPLSEELANQGWTTVLNIGDLVSAGYKVGLPVQPLAVTVGLVGSKTWVNAHPNTMLRFYSAILRTIHEVGADPKVLDDYAPYLNGLSGTNLTAKQIDGILESLDPIAPYETGQKQFFTNPKSAYYYKSFYANDAKAEQASGALPKGVNYVPDNFVWAGQIYQTLHGYQLATDTLMAKLAKQKLTAAQTALVAKATMYESWYDYLDAYRAVKAAMA
jgi:ABC-type nitrate/sulfonate/bicarbonate transport system substrate-binding protein